ncbi:C6 zinc finger domain-containing protein [Colletotrichum orchidophilum]|uniref:C6 zinc finger domain-containing protein n=1 Tax=Colletotrichum orchidophilum TaxID=1209926 RepID=A0A1G4AYM8_9PEZI|nr:C6 zinc finger domain-containing protein [Colletotrichum orchidophilum]OHE94205.1 C6 zinc finger domain-containing protein [Colletotrichum orchidophilum]
MAAAIDLQDLPRQGARFPTKYRRNFPRSKNGCLTCRARRKKCDECKPCCTPCIRTRRECTWSVFTENATSDENSTTVSNSSQHTNLLGQTGAVISAATTILEAPKDSSSLRASLTFGTLSHLSEVSRPLYDQYLAVTAEILARGPSVDGNPFINYVLPLAVSDSLVLDCVLAIGGAHLVVLDPKQPHSEVMTRRHYARLLAGLQKALLGEVSCAVGESDEDKKQYILLILLLLCVFEGVQGDNTGAIYHHVRASRHYVIDLAADIDKPSASSKKSKHIRGFLLEIYAMFALKLAVTPRGLQEEKPVTLDPFLGSLKFLSEYKSRGFMLSFGHGLFAMIPEISNLLERRRLEELCQSKSDDLYESYKSFVETLDSWDSLSDVLEGEGACPRYQQSSAVAIYRTALVLILHSAFHEGLYKNPELIAEINLRIDKILPLCWAVYASNSPLRRMLLWPASILASCCKKPEHVKAFRLGLNSNPRALGAVTEAAKAIELLWRDDDPRAYGPRGLNMVMKNHGLSLSVC